MTLVHNFRPIKKPGAFKATFKLVVPALKDLTVLGCKYFAQDDGKHWWKMPDFQSQGKDAKEEWYPYVSFKDKEFFDKLKADVLEEIADIVSGQATESPF